MLRRELKAFASVGVLAAIVHYGLLIGLVEAAGWQPVGATLVGYAGGGLLSYRLNRSHTFASARPHAEAGWRFALVAGAGFGLTWLCMRLLVGTFQAPYLPAQVATTGLVMVWSYAANKFWTFGGNRP